MPQSSKTLVLVPRVSEAEPNPAAGSGQSKPTGAESPIRLGDPVGRAFGRHRRWAAASLVVGVFLSVLAVGLWPRAVNHPVGVTGEPPARMQIVWQAPGAAAPRLYAVEPDRWRQFTDSRRPGVLTTRTAIQDQIRADLGPALAPVFREMKGRVPDYISWLYFFPITYRLAVAAVISVLSQDSGDPRTTLTVATDAINGVMQDQFATLVMAPKLYEPAVDAQVLVVLKTAEQRWRAAMEAEGRALAAFLTEHGTEPLAPAAGAAVVLATAELAVGEPSPLTPPAIDPADQAKGDRALWVLQTSVGAEGLMLAVRQMARRVVATIAGDALTALVVPLAAGSLPGVVEGLLPTMLGGVGFLVGIAAEYGTIKGRQVIEQDQMTALLDSVVERLQETQTAHLADQLVRHVDTWMGVRR